MTRMIYIDKIESPRYTGRLACLEQDGKIMELYPFPESRSKVGNIYVAKVEDILENIQGAFLRISDQEKVYFPLKESHRLIYADGSRRTPSAGESRLRPGDTVLVQILRDAMKGKLAAATSDYSFSGSYLVLTWSDSSIGVSAKLSPDIRKRLKAWVSELQASSASETVSDSPDLPDVTGLTKADLPGVIVRTNAAFATQDELRQEYDHLMKTAARVLEQGIHRTLYSCVYQPLSEELRLLRDIKKGRLDEIVTDSPLLYSLLQDFLSAEEGLLAARLRLYDDTLLPLSKVYRAEAALEECFLERIWLPCGGFLVIQQTEAFTSIDVNSGKYKGKKNAQDAYLKINLEAAREIARQLRLRNLSGIILVDCINMKDSADRAVLLDRFRSYLGQDPVAVTLVDMTPLQIVEITRQKVRAPVTEL